jgi:hypothetical protein
MTCPILSDCIEERCRYWLDGACSYAREHSAQPKPGRAVRTLAGKRKRRARG